MAVTAAVGLGSNLGDRARHITDAVAELSRLGRTAAVSALYETAPIGGPEQERFLNAVVLIDTELSARDLLSECVRIEQRHGRERRERWGPRTLDLDLLLYGTATISEAGLTVPHPRLGERRFVLEPLLEVWPDARLPDGSAVADLLVGVADQDVRRLPGPAAARSAQAAAFLVAAGGALLLWWLMDWLWSLLS